MADVQGLISHWSYTPSSNSLSLRWRRFFLARFRARPAPQHRLLKRPGARREWIVYFVFLPDGRLTESHRFTLERLRAIDAGLFVVCACKRQEDVPGDLQTIADAVCWKALPGYDFSGYSIALRVLSEASPGATVLTMNDSIMGPFTDLAPYLTSPPWEFTGMTASSLIENHLQSYAFVIRDLTPLRIQQLSSVFPTEYAYDAGDAVVICQETYVSRVASRYMSVGAHWFAPTTVPDPTLNLPLQLLDSGFPFMKKSLFGKHTQFQMSSQDTLRARLKSYGHPDPFD